MSRVNVAANRPQIVTHEGGRATKANPVEQLRRSVLSCMLWEDGFYEGGVEIAKRIEEEVGMVSAETAAVIARLARTDYKLRHAPLWVTLAMCRKGGEHRRMVADTLAAVIQRPDELAEFMAMYWKPKKVPVAKQVQKGLARAFAKFDEYSLAKYNRDSAVKLRDVLFLSHAKPQDQSESKHGGLKTLGVLGRSKKAPATKFRGGVNRHTKGQGGLWKRLIEGELATPDTWEVSISACKTPAEKKMQWKRLLAEKKLFALALIRNIRNMVEAGVPASEIKDSIREMQVDRVLPYRFITAARYNPHYEDVLEEAMFKCIEGLPKLSKTTALVIDVSGSMDSRMSGKSEMTFLEAACGLAILCRELCEDVKVFTFSNRVAAIPNRRGFALRDAIDKSQSHGGTMLAASLKMIDERHTFDRCIVITDEQSHDGIYTPKSSENYLINVAANQNGVSYKKNWNHLDGFSEAVFNWICEFEKKEPVKAEKVRTVVMPAVRRAKEK